MINADYTIADHLPSSIINDNINSLAKVTDAALHSINPDLLLIYPNIGQLNEELIDHLAIQLHVDDFDQSMSIDIKKRQVEMAILMHRYKGTLFSVRNAVELIAGNCKITEWMEYGGNPYYFKAAVKTEEDGDIKVLTKKILRAIRNNKNIRSWLDELDILYPPILLPSINPVSNLYILTTTNIEHISWNIGAAARVRLDAKYAMDGTTRLNGLDPKNGYYEIQHHILECDTKVAVKIVNTRINIINGESNMDGNKVMDGERVTSYTVSNAVTMDVIPLECRPHTYGGYHNYDGETAYAWPFMYDGQFNYDGVVLGGFYSGNREDKSYNIGPNVYDGSFSYDGSKRFGWTDAAGKGGIQNL